MKHDLSTRNTAEYLSAFLDWQSNGGKLETRADMQAFAEKHDMSVATLYNRLNEIKAATGRSLLEEARTGITGPIESAPKPPKKEENMPTQQIDGDIAAALSVIMSKGGLNAEQVKALIAEELAKTAPAVVIHRITTDDTSKDLPTGTVLPNYWQELLDCAAARANIYMHGKPGTGKTHSARLLAEALGLPFYAISVTTGMSESQLAGWYVPREDGNGWHYRASDFVTAYEHGGIFLADELDSADANTACFINSALANGHFHLPNRPGIPAKRHKDFIFVGAGNTKMNGGGRAYSGRNALDGALIDRFAGAVIETYYSEAVEKAVVDADVLNWSYTVRGALDAAAMHDTHCSTRFLQVLSRKKALNAKLYGNAKAWLKQLHALWSVDQIAKFNVHYNGKKS